MTTLRIISKGGTGSGFHGHAGRIGLVGGSLPTNVVTSYEDLTNAHENPHYWILPDGNLLDNVINGIDRDHAVSMHMMSDEQWYKDAFDKLIDDEATARSEAFDKPKESYEDDIRRTYENYSNSYRQ